MQLEETLPNWFLKSALPWCQNQKEKNALQQNKAADPQLSWT